MSTTTIRRGQHRVDQASNTPLITAPRTVPHSGTRTALPTVNTTSYPVTKTQLASEAEAVVDDISREPIGARAISIAMQYIGITYAYGGASPEAGFDCSGLVKFVYAQLGIDLPHSPAALVGAGYQVSSPIQGDIVWTHRHVSLYAGNGMVVEAANHGTPVRYTEQWQDYAVYVRPY